VPRSRQALFCPFSSAICVDTPLASKARFASAMELRNPEMFSFAWLFSCHVSIVPHALDERDPKPARYTGGASDCPCWGRKVAAAHPDHLASEPGSSRSLLRSVQGLVLRLVSVALRASAVSQPSLLASEKRALSPLHGLRVPSLRLQVSSCLIAEHGFTSKP